MVDNIKSWDHFFGTLCSKNSVKYFPINKNDIWRVNILKELIRYDQKHPIQDFSENDIQSIIENVACE